MKSSASAAGVSKLPFLPVRSGILAGFSTRHVLLAVLFTVGYDILGQLGWLDFTAMTLAARLKSLVQMPIHMAISLMAVLAAVAAENTITGGSWRFLRYPVAVLAAVVLSVLTVALIYDSLPAFFDPNKAKAMAALAQLENGQFVRLALLFLLAAYIAILVIALHAVLEANHRASAALHDARLKALDAERDAYAGELGAMQARVDPELLFDSLRAVDQAYADDPVLGQARLDVLIRFLRAAVPANGAAISTVGLEKELAESFAALVMSLDSGITPPEFAIGPELVHLPMPAMIVLPLVRWALAGRPADGLAISLRRHESAAGACLEFCVVGKNSAAAENSQAETEMVRQRLERLYGRRMRFEVSTAHGERRVCVELPISE